MLTTECTAQDGESRQNKFLQSEMPMDCPPPAAPPPDDAEGTTNCRQSSVNVVDASSGVVEQAKEYSLGLLDLPADLRNIIYEYSLLQPDRIEITPEMCEEAYAEEQEQEAAEEAEAEAQAEADAKADGEGDRK